MTPPGMVVVGAGECGARAAFALRENGWTGPVNVRLAEMLIARRAVPDPAALADPSVTLKFLLRSPVGA